MKKAKLEWSQIENCWNLELWLDGKWEFSKAWSPKDQDYKGVGWIHESILLEIKSLQSLGYEVKIVIPS